MGLQKYYEFYCPGFQNISCMKTYKSIAVNAILDLIFTAVVLLAACGNLAVIISISHFKQLHTTTNLLIASLALSDFMIGIFNMPSMIMQTLETCWYSNSLFCFLDLLCAAFLTGASEVHVLFLAVDRYYAVCYPLLYTTKITLLVGWIFVAISWLFPIVYISVIFYFVFLVVSDTSTCRGFCYTLFLVIIKITDFTLSFIVPFAFMIALYTKIFIVAKRHSEKIEDTTKQGFSTKKKDRASYKKQYKATKTIGIVVWVFMLCWAPFYVYCFINPFIEIPNVVDNALSWLYLLNSSFNPLIYGFFYPWFRKAFKLIITCKLFKQDSSLTNLFSKNY